MAQTFDVPNILPDIFALDDPSTGAKSVLRKNLVEVPAQHKVDFNPTNQKNIRFKLTSPGDFLIGRESYLKFNLTLSGQVAASPIRFGLGGAHNLFRNIQIRTLGGGTLLQELDYYNMFQGLEHQFNMDKEYLRRYGPAYGDETLCEEKQVGGSWSVSGKNDEAMYFTERNGTSGCQIIKFINVGDVTDADNVAIATADNGRATQRWFDTKYIAIRTGVFDVAQIYFYEVVHYYTNTLANAALDELYNYAYVVVRPLEPTVYVPEGTHNAATLRFYAYNEHGWQINAGNRAIQNVLPSSNIFKRSITETVTDVTVNQVQSINQTVEICMQPFMSLLQHNIPLFLMKDGIELILELNSPLLAFVTDVTATTYTITDPKFMAMMLTPHASIQERYETMWRSEKGLIYRIPGVKVRKQTSAHGTADTLQFHCGVRSAMKAVLLQNTTDLESDPLFDATMGVPLRIKKYLWKVGGINFPNRDVNIVGTGGECYKQLLMAFDRYGETNLVHRFSDYYNQSSGLDFGKRLYFGAATKYTREGTRFYIAADFRRVNGYGDNLSGIDLSHVPLDLELECSEESKNGLGAGLHAGTKQYYLFVYHDAYLKINSQQVTILS